MIRLATEPSLQFAPCAPASRGREGRLPVHPRRGIVRAVLPVHGDHAAENLIRSDGGGFHLVVAAYCEPQTFGGSDTTEKAVCKHPGRRGLVENDVAAAQCFGGRGLDGEDITVVYEWRHARTVRRETDEFALGKHAPGQGREHR